MKIKGEADTTITSIEGRPDGVYAVGGYIPPGALSQPMRMRFDPKCPLPPEEWIDPVVNDYKIWYTTRGNQRITGWLCDHRISETRWLRITDETPSHVVRLSIEMGKRPDILEADGVQSADEAALGRMQ